MRTGRHFHRARHLCTALAAIGFCCLAGAGEATQPRPWRQSSFADFAAGIPSAVAIDDDGSLRLGPELRELGDLDVQRIWSLLEGPDGRVYAGTGDEGKVICLDRDKSEQWCFDSPELSIHALLLGPDGYLYAGTAPDGLIYRIDPETGTAETLAHTGSHYVWDLRVDAGGRIWAATGEPARILRLGDRGAVHECYAPPTQHVMCLAPRGEDMLAGTAGEARIYALAATGDTADVRLLFSAPQAEIHDLVVQPDGTVLASALPGSAQEGGEPPSVAVHGVAPSGAVRQLWHADEASTLSLCAAPDGGAYLVTDKPARVTHLDSSGHEHILLDLDAMTAAAAYACTNGGVLLGAAQCGRLVSVGPEQAKAGDFLSVVKDFGAHCRWGRISWDGDLPRHAHLELSTRSGNSPEPDATWSPWATVSDAGERVSSPSARYLQYRVHLEAATAPGPVLRHVEVIAQQTNLPPRITQLEVAPYRSDKRQRNGAQDPALAAIQNAAERQRPPQARSLLLVHWQASDPNEDELAYCLYLRGAAQQSWKLTEEETRQTSLLWDTSTMPEGITQLLLVATDAPANAPAEACTARYLSQPFVVDNSPPRITLESGREGACVRIEARMEDRVTPLTGAEFSVDYRSATTRLIAARDGIFDSRSEAAVFLVDALEPGEHVIVVRAWDQRENMGAAQIMVQAP